MKLSTGNESSSISVNADQTRAVVGGIVWLVVIVLPGLEPADAFLLLGPLVIVPLGLKVMAKVSDQQRDCAIFQTGRLLQFPAAVLFAGGWMSDSEVARTWCAIPWMIVTNLFAFSAVRIICRRRQMTVSEFVQCAAMLLIAVGGGWALFYRIEYRPFDFPIGIVKLTAIHFHYAGFALPVIAAAILDDQPLSLSVPIALSITLGIPLVAIGITISPVVELIGSIVLALGCLRLALVVLYTAANTVPRAAAFLLRVAAVCLLCSMMLAIVYAVGEYREVRWIGINSMLHSHGPLNALGFGLCGLIALNLRCQPQVTR